MSIQRTLLSPGLFAPSAPIPSIRDPRLLTQPSGAIVMPSDEGRQIKFLPHIRLWAAVVRRAAVDSVLYSDHEDPKFEKMGKEARSWLAEDYDPTLFNSFGSVCDHLNLPKGVVKAAADRLTEEDARRQRGMEFGDE